MKKGMTEKVTCGLTACTPGSAPGPAFGNEYGRTLLLPMLNGPTNHSDGNAILLFVFAFIARLCKSTKTSELKRANITSQILEISTLLKNRNSYTCQNKGRQNNNY